MRRPTFSTLPSANLAPYPTSIVVSDATQLGLKTSLLPGNPADNVLRCTAARHFDPMLLPLLLLVQLALQLESGNRRGWNADRLVGST